MRFFFLSLIFAATASAQVGTWQTHTDMKLVRDIVAGETGIWAATSGGVFRVSANNEYTRYTNVDGLSDIDYTAVAIDEQGRVIAGSSVGMINVFVPEDGWFEVADITRATEIPSRGITTISTRDGFAYIGTEFGVAVYDLDRREFGDTYQKFGGLPLRDRVNAVHFDGEDIWVATASGVARGNLANLNLKDPANWTSWEQAAGYEFGDVRHITGHQGAVLAILENNAVLRYQAGEWLLHIHVPGTALRLLSRNDVLYMMTDIALYELSSSGTLEQRGNALLGEEYPPGLRFLDLEFSAAGEIMLASTYGVTTYVEGEAWAFSAPNGPNSNFFRAMTVDNDGILWAASGITDGGRGIYSFDGNRWEHITITTDPEIGTNAVTGVAAADDGSMYFATWGKGVFRRGPDGSVAYYNGESVPGFPGIFDNLDYHAVRSVNIDSRGNLWVLHYLSNSRTLGCMTPEGTWHFFSDPTLPTGLMVSDFEIDQYDRIWVIVNGGGFRGILLFDHNNSLTVTSDDSWTRLPAIDANGLNAEQNVLSLVTDLLGDAWIGTDRGIRTIFNPLQPDRVSKTCFNTRCNVEGQSITSLAIDPVNNKWLGTKDGVFVLTADGSEIMAHYDTENSPLLDNEIETLLIHPATGVAYIATRRGLSSLNTAYVQPESTFSEISVGPNPFRPGRDDRLQIDGLIEGSVIKVLTVSGDLVAEITTPGGRVGFWNGRTRDGSLAASGVYFIVAAAPNGSQSAITKVAVLRE